MDEQKEQVRENPIIATEPITKESLQVCSSYVEWWISAHGLEVVFFPALEDKTKSGGVLDFDYDLQMDNRRVHKHMVVSLMRTWLGDRGYMYATNILSDYLDRWIYEQYKIQVPDEFTLPLLYKPRMVLVKKRGRPRNKDGTSQTLYFKEDTNRAKFGSRWHRLENAAQFQGTKEELEQEIIEYEQLSNKEHDHSSIDLLGPEAP